MGARHPPFGLPSQSTGGAAAGLDLTKNVCEVFGTSGYIVASYTYTPYGSVTISGSVNQPLNWCSELQDSELKLYCYNYRYYNSSNGNFITRDPLPSSHLYNYAKSSPVSAIDILGLAVLNKHLKAADIYLSSLVSKPNANNTKCFRYGNIYPDIPDTENININIPSYTFSLFWTQFSTPAIYISHEDLFLFLAENHLDKIPYVSDIKELKKTIDSVVELMKNKMKSVLPSWMLYIFDKASSLERLIRNKIFDRVSYHFSYFIDNIKALNTHYGATSYWYAMSTGREPALQEFAYNNFINKLEEQSSSGTSECECWKKQGFALHMLVDLTTKSHAHISNSGGVTKIHFMHYYPYQNKDLHKEMDESPDISTSITMFKKLRAGIPIKQIFKPELKDSKNYTNTWYGGID